MPYLIWALMRDCMPRRWWFGFFAGLLLATVLSFDTNLGAHSLGSYLAYVSVFPLVLLFRCGWVLQQRTSQGWPHQEKLRDSRGYKAPLVEFFGLSTLLLIIYVCASIPCWWNPYPSPPASAGYYPVTIHFGANDYWLFDLHSPVPASSTLLLTLDWSQVQNPEQDVWIQDPNGRKLQAIPGELLRWPLSPAEAKEGKMALHSLPKVGVELRRPLTRLEIPRPGMQQGPHLLLLQFLFFWPLFAMLLAWHRRGKLSGTLSAWTCFALGSLAAMPMQATDLDSGPLALLARAVLLLKLALPPVEGLLAAGARMERLAFTSAATSISGWLVLGALSLWLACKEKRPVQP